MCLRTLFCMCSSIQSSGGSCVPSVLGNTCRLKPSTEERRHSQSSMSRAASGTSWRRRAATHPKKKGKGACQRRSKASLEWYLRHSDDLLRAARLSLLGEACPPQGGSAEECKYLLKVFHGPLLDLAKEVERKDLAIPETLLPPIVKLAFQRLMFQVQALAAGL